MDTDPLKAARKGSAPALQRRFYSTVALIQDENGFSLRLDGKRALTPGRHPLTIPHRTLADAVAAEWRAQIEIVNPAAMPATRLSNTAIDGVAERVAEVQDATIAYAASDLLIYRAGEPDAVVQRQAASWDPILAWAERRFGVRFILAEGVVHVAQPPATLQRLASEIRACDDPFRLAGLNTATTLSGSALIALAMRLGAIDLHAAWAAAHVDEDWNIGQWGEDSEARAGRDRRLAEFRAAALVLAPG